MDEQNNPIVSGDHIRIDDRNALFIGRIGSGKTSLFGACLRNFYLHNPGWLEDDKDVNSDQIMYNENGVHTMRLYDIRGFTGDRLTDFKRFNSALKTIAARGSNINRVFLCFSGKRLTHLDVGVIKSIEAFSSEHMKRIMTLVVTHSSDLNLELKAVRDVFEMFRFMIDSRHEGSVYDVLRREGRVILSDLIDIRRFKDENARVSMEEEWRVKGTELLSLTSRSEDSVSPYSMVRTNLVKETLRAHRVSIILVFLIALIFVMILLKIQGNKKIEELKEVVENKNSESVFKWFKKDL